MYLSKNDCLVGKTKEFLRMPSKNAKFNQIACSDVFLLNRIKYRIALKTRPFYLLDYVTPSEIFQISDHKKKDIVK